MKRLQKSTSLFGVTSLLAALLLSIGSISTPSPSFAAKGGNGGGGGGGDSSDPPVLYKVTQIVNSLGGVDVATAELNNFGEIVGIADNANGENLAFIYTPGTGMLDLNSLFTDEERAGYIAERAHEINDSGQILGFARKDGVLRMCLFDLYAVEPEQRFFTLPRMPDTYSLRNGEMNALGEIVGTVRYGDGSEYSIFLYKPDGTIIDLGELMNINFQEHGPAYINDLGQIIVSSGGGTYRLSPDGNGGFTQEFIPDVSGLAINNFGTISGSVFVEEKGGADVSFRYSDHLELIKDGRKNVRGRAQVINDDGDLGIQYLEIYTDYQSHGLLLLDDLIVPEDVALFSEDISGRHIQDIGERDSSGFFPMLVIGTKTIFGRGNEGNTLWRESFLLIPMDPGN